MYIMIFEDGQVFKSDTINDNDIRAWNDGILDIIDCEAKKQYNGGEWVELKDWVNE